MTTKDQPTVDPRMIDALMVATQTVVNAFSDILTITSEAAEDFFQQGFDDTTLGNITFTSDDGRVSATLVDEITTVTITVRDVEDERKVLRIVATPLPEL